MSEYKTIKAPADERFVEKKSEFIGFVRPVLTNDEAVEFVAEIRAAHRKATHVCYAYILRHDNTSRFSDDGEPQGTAGIPMLGVLQKEGLVDVCAVVVRYFGGVLLGAGGLVRAYSKAVSAALGNAEKMLMIMAQRAEIEVEYPLYGRLPAVFAEFDARVVQEDFSENVKISLWVREKDFTLLSEKLVDVCNGKIIVKTTQNEFYNFA